MVRIGEYTAVVMVRAALKRTKMRMPSAPPFQFSTFSVSNFSARVIYMEKMGPEGSV